MTTVNERIREVLFRLDRSKRGGAAEFYDYQADMVIEAIGIPEEALNFVADFMAIYSARIRPH